VQLQGPAERSPPDHLVSDSRRLRGATECPAATADHSFAALTDAVVSPVEGSATSVGGKPANRSRAVSAHWTANIQVALRPTVRRVLPISYSTSRDRFARDAKQCEQKCPSRSRLFVYRNPGEDVDAMFDLQGRRYRNLPTAFLHRTRHVADCTCRGNPWDEAALARHRAYAETARQKVAGKTADKPAMTHTRSLRDQARWARSE
jgi:hypothetical protein